MKLSLVGLLQTSSTVIIRSTDCPTLRSSIESLVPMDKRFRTGVLLAARCDICGGMHSREMYTARDRLSNSNEVFSVAVCEGCGVLRTLPEMDETTLGRFYPADYWGAENEPSNDWIERSQHEKISFLRDCRLTGGKILDVGCGSGFFLRALDSRAWERYGVEVGMAASVAAARSLGDNRIHRGSLIEAAVPAAGFDVISFWSSLEHTTNPRANVAEARRIIRLGGSLIIQAPNAASYQARWFKSDWFALDVPRHRYHFTLPTLTRLLEKTGFEVYYSTCRSTSHNSHSFRQSLKNVLRADESPLGYTVFCLAIPFVRAFNALMECVDQGATITMAARAV